MGGVLFLQIKLIVRCISSLLFATHILLGDHLCDGREVVHALLLHLVGRQREPRQWVVGEQWLTSLIFCSASGSAFLASGVICSEGGASVAVRFCQLIHESQYRNRQLICLARRL